MTIDPRRPGKVVLLVATLLVMAGSLAAHDLFLKLDSYFLPVNTAVRVPVLNGTFTKSESVVARDRVAGITVLGPGGATSLDTTALTARGDTSFINLRTGPEGTYVLGFSVRPRENSRTGAEFMEYLKAEGMDDLHDQLIRTGVPTGSVSQRYAKHVKAIFQVGDSRSDSWARPLGYQAEIVPLENPTVLRPGDTLRIRCLIGGVPAAGVTVIVGGQTPAGTPHREVRLRTDPDGMAAIPLTAGRAYAKFLVARPTKEVGINYDTHWATLTFAVR